MDDKRVAYVEDVVNELSDMIDKLSKLLIIKSLYARL